MPPMLLGPFPTEVVIAYDRQLRKHSVRCVLNGYIELDDDELRKNYEQDVEDGADEESYQKWREQELSDLETMDLDWIRSRYTIEDHVEMEDDPDYTIDIPVDFLSE